MELTATVTHPDNRPPPVHPPPERSTLPADRTAAPWKRAWSENRPCPPPGIAGDRPPSRSLSLPQWEAGARAPAPGWRASPHNRPVSASGSPSTPGRTQFAPPLLPSARHPTPYPPGGPCLREAVTPPSD